jgi:HlyD family secretion protein
MERIAVRSKTLKRTLKNKWMIFSLIAILAIFSGVLYYYKAKPSTSNEKTIQTSTIGTGDIILSATGLGTLIPADEVSFGFKQSGQVSDVLVSLGEKVEAGQVLARLDSTTLELQYKQAEGNVAALSSPAEIASAQQAVADAKASLDTAKDDLQFMIGPELFLGEEQLANALQGLESAQSAVAKDDSDAIKQKLSEAEAAVAAAQKTLDYAYKNYSNSYTLQTFTYPIRNDKGVTKQRELMAPTDAELLNARATYALAVSNLNDAQNYLDVLNGTKKTEEVPTSSVTSITDAKLTFDSAKAALEATELIAPISGTITAVDINVGEDIGTAAVVTISNMDQPYTLDVNLDETDWDKAKVGYTASVTFDLLPDDNYPAKITQVYPMLDDSSGTSMVHIVVQLNQKISADLPVGSTASVDVTGGEALNAVLVPVSAVKEVTPGTYVVYLMQNGKPVEQQVELGLQDILNAEVKSGLKRGDVVLTDATTLKQ